jgi:hypothetical protein
VLRRLPDWDNKEGVAKLADELVAEREARIRPFRDYGAADGGNRLSPFDEDAHWPDAERKKLRRFIRVQRDAVRAAERGDPTPLNDLLDEYADYVDWFEPETLRLAVEVYKPKKRGGQKKTRYQRIEATVTHRAAANFQYLRRHLRELYPSIRSVSDRAIEIAAAQVGMSSEKLRNHVNRSRKARQRIN